MYHQPELQSQALQQKPEQRRSENKLPIIVFSYLLVGLLCYKLFNFSLVCFHRSDISIDAHGLKIQGRGYGMFLPKFLGGVKGFRKNCYGGSTYFAFYCIFINKFFKNLPGGVLFHTPPPPLAPPPLCASMDISCQLSVLRS